MSKLNELNNYIADVPMRFSDKYLSLQVNNTFSENTDGEDFLKFKVDDYKFNAELIAIEIFEIHQKKKQQEQALKKPIENRTKNTPEQPKPSDDLKNMTVGDWSQNHYDNAASEDWSEDDWIPATLEAKVLTPSTIPEKITDQNTSINNTSNNSQLSFISPNKNGENSQSTLSSEIQQNLLKVQNHRKTKIPETAVEMPTNDQISNLSVRFGTIDFGANNSFGSDSNLFNSASQGVKKQENLSLLPSGTENPLNVNRSTNDDANETNDSILQTSVLPPTVNDSLLNSHRKDKSLSANNYTSNNQQIERKNDYTYKPSSYVNDNAYSSPYQASIPSNNVGYYSNANQVGTNHFGSSGPISTMTPNLYDNTYNNVSANTANHTQNVPNMRDIDSSVPQQQASASSVSVSNKPYEPGAQTTQVGHSAPYMGQASGNPLPYPYPYDVQTPRDHGYSYTATDVKYNRGNESDHLPVSSQAAGVDHSTQRHNQPYINTYPPGYSYFPDGINFANQGFYNTAQHPYPVAQGQTTAASAGSAFAKTDAAANYESRSYNSGYDSLGNAVAQNQDYVNKTYSQQLQPHKQMNKNYDKQGFQQSTQFNLASTTPQSANLASYGPAAYALHQQNMHHTSAGQTQKPPGVDNQR